MSLFGPKYKDDDPKFLNLKEFYEAIGYLLSQDRFLSRKQVQVWADKTQGTFDTLRVLKENDSLDHWCKTTKSNPQEINRYLGAFSTVWDSIKRHNEAFVQKHLVSDKEYLDSVLKADDPNIVLDDDQRQVVLNDEDYMLVIAGAGAGKTTTLEAKAKYLVDKQKVDPSRILVISFTRKATEELVDRFKRIGVPAKISTFHSIGNALIKSNEGKHNVKDSGFLFETLKTYLVDKMEDEGFMRKIMLFFASYLDMPLEEQKSIELYKKALANDDFSTMKSDLDDFKEALTKKKITIRSERVRSQQECEIANYLYINGIDYEYEPVYPYCLPGSQKPYTPDFRLTQGDRVVYLEHFGINEDGTNWRFNEEELAAYKKSIGDKIALHKKHGTELIYTYSSYSDGKCLIHHLKELLETNRFKLHQREPKVIYHEIAERAQDRYFIKFIQLLKNFINRFKTCNYKLEKFAEFSAVARENKDERTLLFLDITRQCFIHYEAALKEANGIDFEDMINNASDILEEKTKRHEKIPYDYIFIDEYQDISTQRFNLAEKLSKCSDAKILAVGDDWQSIFRFSGADITLFTDFEKKMGYGKSLYLTHTHRNSQELIDSAGSFVMVNGLQKKKSLKSDKHIQDPIVIMSYDDQYASRSAIAKDPTVSPYYRMGKAIEAALENIHDKFGDDKTVLLLGRYNFDGRNLNRLSNMFMTTADNRVISKAFPKMKIRFMTAHSSKGLGADNVIVVNGKDDVLGFPSKIEDDPVMKLVLKDTKEIDYAEERRLFYVALTRTKNKVYLITPKSHPSIFITELMKKHTNVVLNGPVLTENGDDDNRYCCPRCGYPLQVRKKGIKGGEKEMTLYICSNDPEVCGFVTNDISGGKMSIQKCPECEDGYLIVKKIKNNDGTDSGRRMLGCTNYRIDGKGCNYAIQADNYSDNWEQVSRKCGNYFSGDKVLPIDKCLLASYPVMVFLKIIRYCVGKLSLEKHFNFNAMSLVSFLIGEETNALSAYHLTEDKAFGCINAKSKKLLFACIRTLVEFGFLEEEKEQYHHLHYLNKEITEDFARKFFECFIH